MPFTFTETALPGVVLVEAKAFEDARGTFLETYQRAAFRAAGIDVEFVQDNFSRSIRGVLRGLHYQLPPKAQGKLVAVLRGEVFDVAVDLRVGSPTYGQSVGVLLSAANRRSLYIPPGFAHGFCTVSEEADVLYKVTSDYAPALDRGVRWNDPALAIRWPIETPRLSAKDASLPALADADAAGVYEGPPR